MAKRFEIDVESGTEIHVEKVGRALHMKAWDLPRVRIDFLNDGDSYQHKGKKLSLKAESDCMLRVPADCSVRIESVDGDAHITGIAGAMRAESISGTLFLKRMGDVRVSSVKGNCIARDISGSIRLDQVNGNTSLKNVQGNIVAREVSANFDLKNGSDQVSAIASGNASLRSKVGPDANYDIQCAGNAYIKLDDSHNLTVNLKSMGRRILVKTDTENQSIGEEKHMLKIGDGQGKLSVEAGGHIDFQVNEGHDFFTDFDFAGPDDFGNMMDEINDQVSIQLEAQLQSLESQLDSLSTHFQSSGDEAIRKAQARIERAQQKLEKRLYRPSPRHPLKPVVGVYGVSSASEPVSDEERMKVLEMVQEKKISVEEAEKLLATLEGREIPSSGKAETEVKDE